MSLLNCDVLKITTGMRRSSGLALIAVNTANPSFFGRLKSRITRWGRAASAYFPMRSRNAIASTPSSTLVISLRRTLPASASRANPTSAGLSSTRSNRSPDFISCSFLPGRIMLVRIVERHGKLENRARSRLRLNPDSAAVALDNLFADRQPNTIAGIFGARVQTLKDYKNILRTLRRNSDPVIAHAKQPVPVGFFSLHGNQRRFFAAELDGVSDQILNHLSHLCAVGPDFRKGS